MRSGRYLEAIDLVVEVEATSQRTRTGAWLGTAGGSRRADPGDSGVTPSSPAPCVKHDHALDHVLELAHVARPA